MSEINIEGLLNQDEIQALELKDLEELLNSIDSLSDFDFAKLDSDDSSLSETELKLKQHLLEINGKKEFLKTLIEQLKLLKGNENNENSTDGLSCRRDEIMYHEDNINFYINNPEYIIKIEDIELLNKVLEKSNGIYLDEINPILYKEFLLHKKINITYESLTNIDKNTLELNLVDLCKKVGNDFAPWILLKAVSFGIDKEKIKDIIRNNNIVLNDMFQDINVYLGNYEKIDKKDFEELKEKYNNFDNTENKSIENKDLEIITNYLIQNQKEPENIKIICKLIEQGNLGFGSVFIFMANPHKDITISIIKLYPGYIGYTPSNVLSDPDVINAFLNEKGKKDDHSIDDKIKLLKFLNLSDINNFLNVMDFFLKNGKNIESIYLEMPHLIDYINKNIIDEKENKISEVDEKYIGTLEKILKSFDSGNTKLVIKKAEITNAKKENKDLNGILDNNTLNNFIEGFEEKLKGKLRDKEIKDLSNIINENKEINENTIIKLTNKIFTFENLKQKEKEEIFGIIINHFKDFKKEEIEKLGNEIDLTTISREFKIIKDGKEELDKNSINLKFKEFIETKKEELKGLKGEEKEQKLTEFKNEFIKLYFNESNTKDKDEILKILELSLEVEAFQTIGNNIPAYFEYVRSGSELSFTEYAKENNIVLNQASNSINNESSNNKIETNSYSYDTNSGSLQINLLNGIHNISLSPEEKSIIKSNPEALKNIIDFYKTLNELGLSDLWNIKNDIFKGISNKIGIGFNIDGNYLNENEVKLFLNSILSSVGKEKIDPTKSMIEFKNIFSQKNERQIISNGYSDSAIKKGISKITETFLEQYVLGKPYFDIDSFTKNI